MPRKQKTPKVLRHVAPLMAGLRLIPFAVISFSDGYFVQVPGESNESLARRWPGAADACLAWAEGEPGYELRRLTTRRAKFFPEAREELLRKASSWTVLPECPATSWTIRLLNASAFADRNSELGEVELADVIQEILSSGEKTMLQTVSSRLALFGLLGHAGRRKRSLRGTGALSPVIWDVFTELPHWSLLQRQLWGAIRSRRPLPLAPAILELSRAGSNPLLQAVLFLTSAQEIRLRSGDILSASSILGEVSLLVSRAAGVLEQWVTDVSQEEMVRGLRDWPVVQLLADLEVSDLAELQAMGRDVQTLQQVRFFPSPDVVPSLVLPYREPLSDHDRDIGRFHCTTDFFAEVEYWIRESLPGDRMVAVEVACWLPDCLVWAGHRLGGRISAACLEADDLAATAGRRSIKLNGFEGQVHMLQRRVTSSPSSVRWHCRDHDDMSHEDNIEDNVHLSNDRRCGFQKTDGFNDEVDHLATSIDDEVERLGFDHIDILKLSISSMDILRSAWKALRRTSRVLLATEPRQTMMQVEFLKTAGFQEIQVPMPEKSGGSTPYSFYLFKIRFVPDALRCCGADSPTMADHLDRMWCMWQEIQESGMGDDDHWLLWYLKDKPAVGPVLLTSKSVMMPRSMDHDKAGKAPAGLDFKMGAAGVALSDKDTTTSEPPEASGEHPTTPLLPIVNGFNPGLLGHRRHKKLRKVQGT
eukprot:s979_g8.t1